MPGGSDHPGRNGVDGDALFSQLFCHHAGHTHHGPFCRDIGHLSRVGEKVGARSDVNDATVLAFLEKRINRLGNIEISEVVDLDEPVHLLITELMPRGATREDSCIIDQNINSSVASFNGSDGLLDLAFTGYVAALGIGFAACRANFIDRARGVLDIENLDLCAFGRQSQRCSPPDTGSRS